MARRKKKSETLGKAQKRIAGMLAIDPKLAISTDLTLDIYRAKARELTDLLQQYNRMLSLTDELQNKVAEAERVLADLSERMLMGVAALFGHDSNEYEKAGGTRKSERKRPKRGGSRGEQAV